MRNVTIGIFLLAAGIVGCGRGPIIYDTVSPSSTQFLDAGQSLTLTSKVFNDPANGGVNWSVSGAGSLSNATATTVVYTAPATIVAGATTASIKAIPVNNPSYAAGDQIVLASGPAITTTTLPQGIIGTAYNAQITSTGGSSPLVFTVTSGSLPAGLSLSSGGLLSGTPTTAATSIFTVTLTDAAASPVTLTQAYTVTVVGAPLVITTTTVPNAVSGASYSTQLMLAGGVSPYTWSISSGTLPAGLLLSATTGLISGTLTAQGNFSFTVQVKDTEPTQQTVKKSFGLTVYAPLVITTTSLPSASVHDPYNALLQSTGGTAPLTFSLKSGTLPNGITFSNAGVLSGTPTATGSSTLIFQVTDSSLPQQTASVALTLQVLLSTLTITTTSLPQAAASVKYSATLQSSGGHQPVTWALASGSTLPSGLTLSSAGVLSGITTFTGTANFTVQATDATPYTVSQLLSLTVVPLLPLVITTTSLPSANIAASYSATLAATGGATPYTWNLSAGSLPVGLTLSNGGVLSGTPITAGTYSFTVQVADSETVPVITARALTITVGTTLPPGASNAQLTGSYGLLLKGFNTAGAAGSVSGFATIGSLKADGAGNITGSEDLNTANGVQRSLTITGTYTLGADDRGFMVLTVGSTTTVYAISAGEVSGGVAQSISLTEFDNSTGAAGMAMATGLAKRQTTSAFLPTTLTGTFVFGLDGESPCNSCVTPAPHLGPVVAAGSFAVDGASAVSSGQEDAADFGTNYASITFSGTFTSPSTATGIGTMHVANTGTLFSAPPTDYTYVIVSANELFLLSNDSHATTTLLSGDARLQQLTTYSAASLSGTAIGYESRAAGSSSTQFPTTMGAVLTRFTVIGSGVATLAQDANLAGTLSNISRSVTYTTAANGRTVIVTGGTSNQTLYPYSAAAGFAIDQAATAAYPGLITYEQQAAGPVIYTGAFEAGTFYTAAPATYASGAYVFALDMGSADSGVTGQVSTILDSSSPIGTLLFDTSASSIFTEDLTSRMVFTQQGSTTPMAILYGITPTRAVAIPAGSTTTPAVISLR